MSLPRISLPEKKHAPIIVGLSIVGGIVASIFLFRKKLPSIGPAFHTKYLLFAGMFGSMVGVLFAIFRAIRFLIKLYP